MDDDYKRSNDLRIDELRADVNALKGSTELLHTEVRGIISTVSSTQEWVKDNAEVTRDVRDILSSFHVMGAVSKWFVTVSAAIALAYGSFKGWLVK